MEKKDPVKSAYLVSKILEQGKKAFLDVRAAGIKGSDLDEDVEKCFKFIEDYYDKYNTVPEKSIFELTFGDCIPAPDGELEFWITEITKEKTFTQGFDAIAKFATKANSGDIEAGVGELREFLKSYSDSGSRFSIESPQDLSARVLSNFEDAQANKMGIPTHWPTVNKWTRGWNPGELVFVGARTGVGKTFFTILFSQCAINQGNTSVLYASGEMVTTMIMRRYAAIDGLFNYKAVRDGNLRGEEEERYRKYIGKMHEIKQLYLLNNSKSKYGFSMQSLEIAVEQVNPGMIVVDAAYLLKTLNKPKSQFEAMAQIAGELKMLALKANITIIASTQLNRTAIQKTTYGDEDFALSDQISWNADYMFTLKQTQENYDRKIMDLQPIKIREGENTRKALSFNWCLERVDFTEAKLDNVADLDKHRKKKQTPYKDDDDVPTDPNDPSFPW